MTQNQVKEIMYSLQRHYPRAYEQVLSEVESGEFDRAKRILQGMSGLVGEGPVDLVLQHLTARASESHVSVWETLQENPDALRILIRSGNRSEAIELYHERTGEDWQASLVISTHFLERFVRQAQVRLLTDYKTRWNPPRVLKQAACIAIKKNSAAVHYRVPRLSEAKG